MNNELYFNDNNVLLFKKLKLRVKSVKSVKSRDNVFARWKKIIYYMDMFQNY